MKWTITLSSTLESLGIHMSSLNVARMLSNELTLTIVIVMPFAVGACPEICTAEGKQSLAKEGAILGPQNSQAIVMVAALLTFTVDGRHYLSISQNFVEVAN